MSENTIVGEDVFEESELDARIANRSQISKTAEYAGKLLGDFVRMLNNRDTPTSYQLTAHDIRMFHRFRRVLEGCAKHLQLPASSGCEDVSLMIVHELKMHESSRCRVVLNQEPTGDDRDVPRACTPQACVYVSPEIARGLVPGDKVLLTVKLEAKIK